jgi:Skp family chaperone for outer membrane proteins
MKKTLISLALVTVFLTSMITALLSEAAQAQNAPAATRSIAVCDVVGVFYEYDAAVALGAEIEKEQERLQKLFEDREQAVIDLEKDLSDLALTSPLYESAFREYHKERLELMAWLEFQQAVLYREQLDKTIAVYQSILEATRTVAIRDGYDVVFFRGDPNVPVETMDDLLMQMRDRRVLYHNPDVDITTAVLTVLNRPQ